VIIIITTYYLIFVVRIIVEVCYEIKTVRVKKRRLFIYRDNPYPS